MLIDKYCDENEKDEQKIDIGNTTIDRSAFIFLQ